MALLLRPHALGRRRPAPRPAPPASAPPGWRCGPSTSTAWPSGRRARPARPAGPLGPRPASAWAWDCVACSGALLRAELALGLAEAVDRTRDAGARHLLVLLRGRGALSARWRTAGRGRCRSHPRCSPGTASRRRLSCAAVTWDSVCATSAWVCVTCWSSCWLRIWSWSYCSDSTASRVPCAWICAAIWLASACALCSWSACAAGAEPSTGRRAIRRRRRTRRPVDQAGGTAGLVGPSVPSNTARGKSQQPRVYQLGLVGARILPSSRHRHGSVMVPSRRGGEAPSSRRGATTAPRRCCEAGGLVHAVVALASRWCIPSRGCVTWPVRDGPPRRCSPPRRPGPSVTWPYTRRPPSCPPAGGCSTATRAVGRCGGWRPGS